MEYKEVREKMFSLLKEARDLLVKEGFVEFEKQNSSDYGYEADWDLPSDKIIRVFTDFLQEETLPDMTVKKVRSRKTYWKKKDEFIDKINEIVSLIDIDPFESDDKIAYGNGYWDEWEKENVKDVDITLHEIYMCMIETIDILGDESRLFYDESD
jgi:hypothetical protein